MSDIEKRAEIALCPFCGDWGAEVAESAVPSIHGGQKQAVYCNTCFCEGPTSETEKGAVEAWNRRAALMPPEGSALAVAARAGLPFIAYAFAQGVDGAEEAGRAIEAALETNEPETYVQVPVELLRIVIGCAYPVSTEIDPRGYRWSEAYLDQALPHVKAALLAARPAVSGG